MSARDKVLTEKALIAVLGGHRRAGRRIVLTNGAFDLMHVGHVRALEDASTLGGVLVVAVNDDRSIRASKGPGRPVVPAGERAELVAALACVDHVVLFHDETVDRLLETLKPDVHAKGRDYTAATVPERETARRLGIDVAIVGDPKHHSSTQILARAASAAEPPDRVVSLDRPDVRGFALRHARRILGAAGWLDLRRLVTSREGAVVDGRDGRFLRRIEVAGTPLFVKVAWPSARRESPVLEFQNHLALRAAGFRAPEPWLAVEGHVDGRSASVLVTREARGLPLDEWLSISYPPADARERSAMARGLGTAIRGLHTARFFHPDLVAKNLLVDGSTAGALRAITFQDLMRLERGGRRLKQSQAAVGLAALGLSLRGVVPARFRLAVLRAYLGGTLRSGRPWVDAVRKRIAKTKGREAYSRMATADAREA